MYESTGHSGLRAGATAVVHESYSFACMRCGYGWEQSYEIEHHRTADGHALLVYVADGHIVPSPLRNPTCSSCGNHLVRIMRPGRVASVRDTAQGTHRVPSAGPLEVPRVPDAVRWSPQHRDRSRDRNRWHWHLADLLQVFRLRHRTG